VTTNFREHPDQYRVGRVEQGVFLVEPYKSEILPFWRFRTPEVAQVSAARIYELFLSYKAENDFVGMDVARKYLQMGFTRARRYANHRSGRKYAFGTNEELPQEPNWDTNDKAQAARIFYGYYTRAETDPDYRRARQQHRRAFG
jgi:hypothetical protein